MEITFYITLYGQRFNIDNLKCLEWILLIIVACLSLRFITLLIVRKLLKFLEENILSKFWFFTIATTLMFLASTMVFVLFDQKNNQKMIKNTFVIKSMLFDQTNSQG
jgi:glucan phosphoethanolaminetransferase (alkaline phosphatase superfamily)